MSEAKRVSLLEQAERLLVRVQDGLTDARVDLGANPPVARVKVRDALGDVSLDVARAQDRIRWAREADRKITRQQVEQYRDISRRLFGRLWVIATDHLRSRGERPTVGDVAAEVHIRTGIPRGELLDMWRLELAQDEIRKAQNEARGTAAPSSDRLVQARGIADAVKSGFGLGGEDPVKELARAVEAVTIEVQRLLDRKAC